MREHGLQPKRRRRFEATTAVITKVPSFQTSRAADCPLCGFGLRVEDGTPKGVTGLYFS